MDKTMMQLTDDYADLQIAEGRAWKHQLFLLKWGERIPVKYVRTRKRIADALKKNLELIKAIQSEHRDVNDAIEQYGEGMEL